MITQFKIFENKVSYREVDLKQLYKNIFIYRNELKFSFHTIQYVFQEILKKLLINKHIQFQRIKNKIDGEVTYNEEGVVQWIKIVEDIIVLKLENNKTFFQLSNNNSQIVKIYESVPLDIEIDIHKYEEERKLNHEIGKYNL